MIEVGPSKALAAPTMAGSRPSIISLSPATTTPSAWAGARSACGTTTRSLRTPASRRTLTRHGNHHLCARGAITHEDSLGNKGRTEAGDVQVMSAGTGIRHAEYNREPEPTTLFQIWIEPDREDSKPHGAPSPSPRATAPGRSWCWRAAAMKTTRLPIRAEARVLGATLKTGEAAEYRLPGTRHAYLVVARGTVEVNGVRLFERDGAAITDESSLRVAAIEDAEIVLVDGRRPLRSTMIAELCCPRGFA